MEFEEDTIHVKFNEQKNLKSMTISEVKSSDKEVLNHPELILEFSGEDDIKSFLKKLDNDTKLSFLYRAGVGEKITDNFFLFNLILKNWKSASIIAASGEEVNINETFLSDLNNKYECSFQGPRGAYKAILDIKPSSKGWH